MRSSPADVSNVETESYTMNKDSDSMKQGVDSEQNLFKESLAVLASNAAVNGASHRG
jgi:hypothetical protein